VFLTANDYYLNSRSGYHRRMSANDIGLILTLVVAGVFIALVLAVIYRLRK